MRIRETRTFENYNIVSKATHMYVEKEYNEK